MSLARVTVAVPAAYVETVRARASQKALLADVKRRVEALGYNSTLLTTQDPTDNRVVVLLTRPVGASQRSADDVLRIVKIETVDEPPRGTDKADVRSHPFDPGLTTAEVQMIRTALAEESNPRHLWGLAASLEPCFPIAASLLLARKAAIETDRPPGAADRRGPCSLDTIRAKRARVDAYAARRGLTRELIDEGIRSAVLALVEGEPNDAPPVVQDLARCLVRQVASGPEGPVLVVDKDALLTACPVTGAEGVLSPAAIQLALATCKPEMARVRSAGVAMGRRSDLQAPTTGIEDMRARSAMVRAQKAIERHRWLRWYERDRAT